MNYQGLPYIKIEDIGDWITNADLRSLRENFALELRGNRVTKQGMLFQGDFGTQHRFYSYPIRPNTHILITAIADNGSGLIRVSASAGHSYSTGNIAFIAGVNGCTEANGVWAITVINSTTFDLVGSTFTNAYTNGGIASITPMSIVAVSSIIDNVTGYEHEVVVALNSASDSLRIFVDTSATQIGTWQELTETMSGTINDGSIGADDFTVILSSTMTENGNTLTITDSVRFPNDYFNGWIARNSTRSNQAYITDFTAGASPTITTFEKLGSNGLGWANTDTIVLYRNSDVFSDAGTAVVPFYTYGNGATPHVRINPRGSRRKATIYYGNPSTRSYGKPMQAIRRTAEKNIFNNTAALLAGWYLRNAQLPQVSAASPAAAYDHSIGSVGGAIEAGAAVQEAYFYSGMACRCTVSESNISTGYQRFQRVIITAVFDEQESDPILQIFTKPTNSAKFSETTLEFDFTAALLPKGLTGLNIYVMTGQSQNDGVELLDPNTANDDYSQYMYIGTIDINTSFSSFGWGTTAKTAIAGITAWWAKTGNITLTYTWLEANGYGSVPILTRLGHVPDFNRSYLTPRFVSSSKSSNSAITVVDEDDNTARLSSISSTTAEDDNFADVVSDNTGAKQQYDVQSTGEMLGLIVDNETIQVFKRYEIEFIDTISEVQRIIPADVIAKDSIIRTPYGTMWAGNNGIWFLETGSYTPVLMNPYWLNRYDGTEFATGSTPYISSAFREAIVGGYNFFYNEAIFFIKTNNTTEKKYCYRYSFEKRRWTVREFQLGTAATNVDIKGFWKREDGTLTIVTANGIFKYPETSVYTDASRINQAGTVVGGNGFERFLKFNFGSIYDLLKSNIFKIFLMDKEMSSVSGSGAFNIKFFANFLSTAFDTKTALMDSAMVPRPIVPRGTVETCQVEISNTSAESDTKQFDVVSFFAGLEQSTRIGNR